MKWDSDTRFACRTGTTLVFFESFRCDWQPGDVFHGDGNRGYRILAVIPRELASEFVDDVRYEMWQIEPL